MNPQEEPKKELHRLSKRDQARMAEEARDTEPNCAGCPNPSTICQPCIYEPETNEDER